MCFFVGVFLFCFGGRGFQFTCPQLVDGILEKPFINRPFPIIPNSIFNGLLQQKRHAIVFMKPYAALEKIVDLRLARWITRRKSLILDPITSARQTWRARKFRWQEGKGQRRRESFWCHGYLSHTIHVWYIYLHLVDFYGKCREICHTWIVWVCWMSKKRGAILQGKT